MSDDLQFFPTPRWLAQHAWEKFTDRNFARVLDSSAGEGALPDAMPGDWSYGRRPPVDCIEIDASKHPILRDKGYCLVGLDFVLRGRRDLQPRNTQPAVCEWRRARAQGMDHALGRPRSKFGSDLSPRWTATFSWC
jgi:hypothetical protein